MRSAGPRLGSAQGWVPGFFDRVCLGWEPVEEEPEEEEPEGGGGGTDRIGNKLCFFLLLLFADVG